MSAGLPFPIEVGDNIRVNSKAPEWAHGRVFTVDAVKRDSVRCWTWATASDVAADWTDNERSQAKAWLLVPFNQIDGPV